MTEKIHEQLLQFFPEETFVLEEIEEGISKGEILTDADEILPYLQTALLDDKVLELELDGLPRVYFTRMKDDIPDMVEEEDEDGQIVMVEADYSEAEYLQEMTHLVTLPVEPGVGNIHLRHSQNIVLRMFTNTFGVEMCTSYDAHIKIRELPVLRLHYPSLARIVQNAREFRAKVPEEMDFIADIEIDEESPIINGVAVDISVKGIAFAINKDERDLFVPEETYPIKLYIDDELLVNLSGRVVHLSKVRKKSSIEYICGIQFDLETKTLAAAIESVVASVQRAHLKELRNKSDESGIDLIA